MTLQEFRFVTVLAEMNGITDMLTLKHLLEIFPTYEEITDFLMGVSNFKME